MSLDEDALSILEMDELLGTQLVVAERVRQIMQEGWTPEHDHHHERGSLLRAGRCYLLLARYQLEGNKAGTEFLLKSPAPYWPWEDAAWKPSPDVVSNLERGTALCCAELDREVCVK